MVSKAYVENLGLYFTANLSPINKKEFYVLDHDEMIEHAVTTFHFLVKNIFSKTNFW